MIDCHSRYVLPWELPDTLDAAFCVRAVRRAIQLHGVPEIFNTDQGWPVYQPAARPRRAPVDGRPEPVPRQCLCLATVAQPQTRGGLSKALLIGGVSAQTDRPAPTSPSTATAVRNPPTAKPPRTKFTANTIRPNRPPNVGTSGRGGSKDPSPAPLPDFTFRQ